MGLESFCSAFTKPQRPVLRCAGPVSQRLRQEDSAAVGCTVGT